MPGSESRFVICPAFVNVATPKYLTQSDTTVGRLTSLESRDESNRYQKLVFKESKTEPFHNLRWDAWPMYFLGIEDGVLKMMKDDAVETQWQPIFVSCRKAGEGPAWSFYRPFQPTLLWDDTKDCELLMCLYHPHTQMVLMDNGIGQPIAIPAALLATAITSGTVGRCQRVSPKRGPNACARKALPGTKYCELHSCPLCGLEKASSDPLCVLHRVQVRNDT